MQGENKELKIDESMEEEETPSIVPSNAFSQSLAKSNSLNIDEEIYNQEADDDKRASSLDQPQFIKKQSNTSLNEGKAEEKPVSNIGVEIRNEKVD